MASARKSKKRGPYLAAAFFCERVMREVDGPLTAIRIIDFYKLVLPADTPNDFPSEDKGIGLEMNGLIGFKSGGSSGNHDLSILMTSPSGKEQNILQKTLQFSQEDNGGSNVHLHINASVYESGLYLFDVELDDTFVTRMPIRINIERGQPPAGDAKEPEPSRQSVQKKPVRKSKRSEK